MFLICRPNLDVLRVRVVPTVLDFCDFVNAFEFVAVELGIEPEANRSFVGFVAGVGIDVESSVDLNLQLS